MLTDGRTQKLVFVVLALAELAGLVWLAVEVLA